MTKTKCIQLDFWKAFIDSPEEKRLGPRTRSVRAANYYDDIRVPDGLGDLAHIVLFINVEEEQIKQIGCGLYLGTRDDVFCALEKRKEQVEAALGSLIWQPLEPKKSPHGRSKNSRIEVRRPFLVADEDRRSEAVRQLVVWSSAFRRVFGPLLEDVKKEFSPELPAPPSALA
jgi:hypothetical protein